MAAWFAHGTVTKTTSAALAASALPVPRGGGVALGTVAASVLPSLRLFGRPRADNDGMAGPGQAVCQPGAQRAGAADDRDRCLARLHVPAFALQFHVGQRHHGDVRLFQRLADAAGDHDAGGFVAVHA